MGAALTEGACPPWDLVAQGFGPRVGPRGWARDPVTDVPGLSVRAGSKAAISQQLALWCLLALLHAGLTAACMPVINRCNSSRDTAPRPPAGQVVLVGTWMDMAPAGRAGLPAPRCATAARPRLALAPNATPPLLGASRGPDARAARSSQLACLRRDPARGPAKRPSGPWGGGGCCGDAYSARCSRTKPVCRADARVHSCVCTQIQGVVRCAPLARAPALKAAALRRRASHQHAQLHKMAALASKSAVRAAAFSGRVITRQSSCPHAPQTAPPPPAQPGWRRYHDAAV